MLEPGPTLPSLAITDPGYGVAASMSTLGDPAFQRERSPAGELATMASNLFYAWYHYPAEEKRWITVSNDTMYFRDWFVGGETMVTAQADGDTQHAEATLPDGSRIAWGKITYRDEHNGQRQCWISSNWVECGTRSLPVLWYVQSQCLPAGQWTMRFYYNDAVFHEGSFTMLPQIDTTKITAMSQLDYPDDNYANRCTMPGSKSRHNCDGREGEIKLSISRLGCALTSAAMTLAYHGVNVDPSTLNDWLIKNQGYSNGNIDFFKVAEYARTVGNTNIQFIGRVDGANDNTLSQLTCKYGPQVIPVWGSGYPPGSNREGLPRGHFVLATGQNADRTTWLITDPAGGRKRTLEGNYGNVSGGYRQFRGPEYEVTDDLNGLVFFLHSPAEMLITDPSGRRTGFDPITGMTYKEIPGASYDSTRIDDLTDELSTLADASKEFLMVRPIDGEYTIKVTGTGTGTYDLDLRAYNRHGRLARVRYDSVPVTAGQVSTYQLLYSGTDDGEQPKIRGGFPGGGQRSDVDQFLAYANPSQRQTTLPAGTTTFALMITYRETVDPSTFQVELNRTDISGLFNPRPGEMEVVNLPLARGRNVLNLSIEGMAGKRVATDKDRLV